MLGMLVFLGPGTAAMFRLARRICLLGMLNLLGAGKR
jgi:hypothetical protein